MPFKPKFVSPDSLAGGLPEAAPQPLSSNQTSPSRMLSAVAPGFVLTAHGNVRQGTPLVALPTALRAAGAPTPAIFLGAASIKRNPTTPIPLAELGIEQVAPIHLPGTPTQGFVGQDLSEEAFKKLIDELGSDDFNTRQKASEVLAEAVKRPGNVESYERARKASDAKIENDSEIKSRIGSIDREHRYQSGLKTATQKAKRLISSLDVKEDELRRTATEALKKTLTEPHGLQGFKDARKELEGDIGKSADVRSGIESVDREHSLREEVRRTLESIGLDPGGLEEANWKHLEKLRKSTEADAGLRSAFQDEMKRAVETPGGMPFSKDAEEIMGQEILKKAKGIVKDVATEFAGRNPLKDVIKKAQELWGGGIFKPDGPKELLKEIDKVLTPGSGLSKDQESLLKKARAAVESVDKSPENSEQRYKRANQVKDLLRKALEGTMLGPGGGRTMTERLEDMQKERKAVEEEIDKYLDNQQSAAPAPMVPTVAAGRARFEVISPSEVEAMARGASMRATPTFSRPASSLLSLALSLGPSGATTRVPTPTAGAAPAPPTQAPPVPPPVST